MLEVIPDEQILGDWRLLRRINPAWIVRNHRDEPELDASGNPIISSQAFQNMPDPNVADAMSVHLETVILGERRDVASVLTGMDGFGLASLLVSEVRVENQVVRHAPEPADSSHAHVIGHKSKGIRKKLAQAAKWVICASV